MNNKKIARELVKIAKSLSAGVSKQELAHLNDELNTMKGNYFYESPKKLSKEGIDIAVRYYVDFVEKERAVYDFLEGIMKKSKNISRKTLDFMVSCDKSNMRQLALECPYLSKRQKYKYIETEIAEGYSVLDDNKFMGSLNYIEFILKCYMKQSHYDEYSFTSDYGKIMDSRLYKRLNKKLKIWANREYAEISKNADLEEFLNDMDDSDDPDSFLDMI